MLLGAYGTAVLRRSDEPVVDWRSHPICFIRKGIAVRRLGRTNDRRYRRGLWIADARP